MRKRFTAVLVGLVVLAVVVAIGIAVLRVTDELVGGPSGDCTVTVGDHTVELSGEQAENAALIAAIGVRRGLPARAVSIALATAYQESKIENIDYGDRDSVGLFQQRPSQGWGTTEELLDPVYATNAFYDALEKIDGYEKMEITVAAQRVQRSAFPDAYADHEEDGRALASALTGNSPATFTCDLDGGAPSADDALTPNGLTPRADAVRKDLLARFGRLSLGGFDPDGVSSGHMEGSAHYAGRAIDIFFRPVNKANRTKGWAVAHYLVANADRLDVRTVIFDDRIWTAGRDGWRDYDPPSSAGDRDILEHRDHVHVDVFA
ncbi:hypothetical protein JK386_12220 [Nocardioides sp. zg-536]|uniref:ARB-07466-like C-terminal domain-containing protein n=1 Tax=Nocardioides faecalis TaxID=2803858 RepID=A0A938YAY1_9ACTN|nr:hypothetical protein [Nocardioides faecalis]MBM9460671.1 hypothetical protein [Nocardioides faecalis]QVI57883.1 hypothetical protein KG111_12595 [Nocardioides faecalis]